MDTKTLVVGQKVYMSSGVYVREGTVEKVTPEGEYFEFRYPDREFRTFSDFLTVVEVRVQQSADGPLLHFNGEGLGRWQEGVMECGPWQLIPDPREKG
jgi:hypothetical protein